MSIPKKQQGREDTYDPAFKIAIAREYLTTSLGYSKLAKKYNLPSVATARHFLRWYRSKYPDGVVEEASGQKDAGVSTGEDALKDANLRIAALEMLLENASKELGIDLVKKFGTKQSGK